MKIQLINPPMTDCFSKCTRSGCFPPLDLLSIASYVQDRHPEFNVEILDGEMLSLKDIIGSLDAEVVGVSPKVFSHETALTIAQVASASGSRVIFGGAWASAIPRYLLQKNSNIEAVCIGDGEEALLALQLASVCQ